MMQPMQVLGRLGLLAGSLMLVSAGATVLRQRSEAARHEAIATALTAAAASNDRFDPALISELPEPVRRYFLHAIADGAPLARAAALQMTGAIKPNERAAWMPFTGKEGIRPFDGFLWQAKVASGPGPLFLEGADYLVQSQAEMQFGVLGLVPVVRASGPETAQSAAGRLAGEALWVPSALLPRANVEWSAKDDEHISFTAVAAGTATTVDLTIDEAGGVREAILQRYRNAEEGYQPFGMVVDEERRFGEYTIPAAGRVGWYFGTDHYSEFFKFSINEAIFY